jgi:hypothetical protein
VTVTAIPTPSPQLFGAPARTILHTERAVVEFGNGKGAETSTILKALYSDGEIGFICGNTGCEYAGETFQSVFAHRRKHAAPKVVSILPPTKRPVGRPRKNSTSAAITPVPTLTAQERLEALAAEQQAILDEIAREEAAALEAARAAAVVPDAEATLEERIEWTRREATLLRRVEKWKTRALTAEATIKRYENAAANLRTIGA